MPIRTMGGPAQPTTLYDSSGNALGSAANPLQTTPTLWNGTSYDVGRGNFDGTALASAARTTTTNSADLTNVNGRGALFYLNVTAASGTGGLSLRVYAKGPASGQYFVINGPPTAKTATGIYLYVFYPGATSGATLSAEQIVSGPIPRVFRVGVTHGDTSSYTYSVGYSLIV